MPSTAPDPTDEPAPAPRSRPPWLGVELRHLAALGAVAREGSFRGAADSLGYVQSAVSQQVARLERIVGARLVERRRGASYVALTEAGVLLLHHYDAIAVRLNAAHADIEAIRCGRAGTLAVGVTESVAARLMPSILRRMASRYPGVEVRMEESRSPGAIAEGVEAGKLDLALCALPLGKSSFELERMVIDPYVLVVPADSPLAARRSIECARELAGLPLIGAGEEAAPSLVEADLREHGLKVRYAFRSESNTAVRALVAAGIGVAIVPWLAVDPLDDRSVELSLDGLIRPRVVGLYWNRERRRLPARDAFLEVARGVGAELQPPISSAETEVLERRLAPVGPMSRVGDLKDANGYDYR